MSLGDLRIVPLFDAQISNLAFCPPVFAMALRFVRNDDRIVFRVSVSQFGTNSFNSQSLKPCKITVSVH